MIKTIIDNIPFELNREQVFKSLHVDEYDDDAETLEIFIEEAKSLGRPMAAYGVAQIDSKENDTVIIEGIKFTSKVLKVNLDHVGRVFPYVCTCGVELENWALSKNDPLEQYWAYTINQRILGQAIAVARKQIIESYNTGKISQMNPGSLENWPINQQTKLFELLGDATERIGVKLTESFLMMPTKSVSGIYFSNEATYENCQLCPILACPNRRASYDSKLFNEKYNS